LNMAEKKLNVILLRHTPDPEGMVAMAAKLCYSASTIGDLKKKIETQDQVEFIKKLAEMGHYSPLEHAYFTFGVEGISRACTHQLVRHRIASYSQQSQRYVDEHSEKHGGVFDYIIPPSIIKCGLKEKFEKLMEDIQGVYDELYLAIKKAKIKGEKTAAEDARYVLPNAAETKIIITMNARELIDSFFRLRTCQRAQWEIRAMATEMLKLAMAMAPNLFKNAGPSCLSGPCPEKKMCCGKTEKVRKEFQKIKKGILNNIKTKIK